MQHTQKLPGIIISDFSPAAPGRALSRELLPNTWQLVDYTTVAGSGTMLATRMGMVPEPVTVDPGLQGWHRIYIALISDSYNFHPGITLQLTNDIGASFFSKAPCQAGEATWTPAECCSEYFWQCADMTGQTITVSAIPDETRYMTGLMWIRAVPMSDDEVIEYQKEQKRKDTKRLHVHTDMYWLTQTACASGEDLLAPFLQDVRNTDAELISVEVFPLLNDHSLLDDYAGKGLLPYLEPLLLRSSEYAANGRAILTYFNEKAHESGLKVYAALRAALTKCPFPTDYHYLNTIKFVEDHPEYCCLDRDGEPYYSMSYAYEEVQEYTVSELVKILDYGFDGVTIFTHRGVMTLFEEPVIDEFKRRYPGTDPRELPLSDPRLEEVHSFFMTQFIRRLRRALDRYSAEHSQPRKGINIITGFSCSDAKLYGVDVESWAEEKLIDSFIPANMRIWEENSSWFAADGSGKIDLERYREAKYSSNIFPVQRAFTDDLERVLANLPHHLEICRRTGVKCYVEIPWEHTRSTEFLHDYVSRVYAAGAENISLWDTFGQRIPDRPEWNLVSKFGHKEELAGIPAHRSSYISYFRVLSYNGISIAAYHPYWRG